MAKNRLDEIIKALEDAHQAATENSNSPCETARRFIRAAGVEDAAQCIAAMVRRASWDGRISREAKEFAASVDMSDEWDRLIDEAYSSRIHMAHLSQIAECMPSEICFNIAESEVGESE